MDLLRLLSHLPLVGRSAKERMKERDRTPLQVQLETFERFGIRLNPGAKLEDIFESWGGPESFELNPYGSLYGALGSEPEHDESAPLANQIWYFDTESLIEERDYERLLMNIGRISGGELVFGNINMDYQDDNEHDPLVRLSFDLNGSHQQWTIRHFWDWSSAAFLSPLNDYASNSNLQGRLVWDRSCGDDWTLGWHTPEQIRSLRALGVDITEITPTVTARKRVR
jgi:hypothetical protein